MYTINEYQTQLALRSSDAIALSVTRSNDDGPIISSQTWHEWGDKFETGAKVLGAIGGVSVLSRDPRTKTIGEAATATAAVASALAEMAKQQEAAARVIEKQIAERNALEKQMRAGMDRSMKEHSERMKSGEYRDPPTRERMAEMGGIA